MVPRLHHNKPRPELHLVPPLCRTGPNGTTGSNRTMRDVLHLHLGRDVLSTARTTTLCGIPILDLVGHSIDLDSLDYCARRMYGDWSYAPCPQCSESDVVTLHDLDRMEL